MCEDESGREKNRPNTGERMGFAGLKKESKEVRRHLKDILKNQHVLKMKKFTQHGRVSTYDHCSSVADLSFQINRFFHLHSDERKLVRGAMLHDFYLYDWHDEDGGEHRLHGFFHAARAADNAVRLLHVSKKEEQIIRSHMWPLNITKVPRCREAWIVCIADKICSLRETVFERG